MSTIGDRSNFDHTSLTPLIPTKKASSADATEKTSKLPPEAQAVIKPYIGKMQELQNTRSTVTNTLISLVKDNVSQAQSQALQGETPKPKPYTNTPYMQSITGYAKSVIGLCQPQTPTSTPKTEGTMNLAQAMQQGAQGTKLQTEQIVQQEQQALTGDVGQLQNILAQVETLIVQYTKLSSDTSNKLADDTKLEGECDQEVTNNEAAASGNCDVAPPAPVFSEIALTQSQDKQQDDTSAHQDSQQALANLQKAASLLKSTISLVHAGVADQAPTLIEQYHNITSQMTQLSQQAGEAIADAKNEGAQGQFEEIQASQTESQIIAAQALASSVNKMGIFFSGDLSQQDANTMVRKLAVIMSSNSRSQDKYTQATSYINQSLLGLGGFCNYTLDTSDVQGIFSSEKQIDTAYGFDEDPFSSGDGDMSGDSGGDE